jgi:thiol-disulfide isomerase/thioredoxin
MLKPSMSERVGWRRVTLAVAAAAAIAIWPACATSEVEPAPAGDLAKLNYTLKDMHGKELSLASLRGRPIILNFWATWCGPCKVEIPALIQLAEQYKSQQLAVLGVSVDDSPEDLKRFAAEFRMNYPVLVGLGHDEFQEVYDAVVMIPVTWFIRPDGTILKKHQGPATKDWLETQIKAMLASTSPEAH